MGIAPFRFEATEEALEDLRARLRKTRWPDAIPGSGWEYGFDLNYLRELCSYWERDFNWRAAEREIFGLPNFRFTANGIGVHFIHERGIGPAPLPLVLTHGWPGSFLEMLRVLPRLTDPARFGGDPADAFDVVVPSLPGFGFSDRPQVRGLNLFGIAELWAELMSALGYARFAAQGGDFGASVATLLGLKHPERLLGIHLNYIPGSYRPYLDPSAEGLRATEQEFLADAEGWAQTEGAYAHIQRTEPQTVAYGLNDSPAALAAWIIGKFRSWGDCNGEVETRFSKDELLRNVTLYWLTQTIGSSCRLYLETRRAPLHFGPGEAVRVPCAIARFPKEAPFPPREWVARGYNVQRWTEMPRGGHFAAAEEPDLLAQDLREFFRPMRRN